jgi:hypothetical protein
MRTYLKLMILSFFLLFSTSTRAQALISRLFGDMLNTDEVEFGLTGGYNPSYMYDISDSEGLNNWNLGFYFHILLKNNSYLSTGVLVKSNVGATGMPAYSMGDPDFDALYQDGTLTKKVSYFYVPILFHQRFNNQWYLEGGFQLGLGNKANDIFEVEALDGDLSYKRSIKDEFKHLDAGLAGGIGYKFKKEIKCLAAGIIYYYGLMNVSELPDTKIRNSSIYFYVKVPIGAGTKNADDTNN